MAILNIIYNWGFTILGICLLILGFIVIYFITKIQINSQNNKINSMIDLVSTMAQEINVLKYNYFVNQPNIKQPEPTKDINIELHKKVVVSDEDTDEDDTDEDEDDTDEDDTDEDDTDEDDADVDIHKNIKKIIIYSHEDDKDDKDDKNIIQINGFDDFLEPTQNQDNDFIVEYNDDDNKEEEDDDDDEDTDLNVDSIKIIHIGQHEENDLVKNKIDEKNIDIMDYKKMQLPKLRAVIVEKGIVSDASKMKKHEILKLLESDE
jgi:hypothetical protein